jgi:putative peptidoglycan lipid II flippase
MAEKNKNPLKAISLVMILTLIGKILGLLRDRLLAVNYGSGMETNAFLAASQIPRNFFDVVFASAVAASFIPVFNEYLTKKGKREAIIFSGNFITVIGLISLLLTGLGIVFAGPLVTLFADGFDAQTTALCVSLTRVMFPTALFTGITFSFVGILQSFDEFNIPALISVLMNIIVIAYYYTFNTRFGIYGLAGAFLVGFFMQAAVQVPSLVKKGFFYKPSLNLKSDGMKKVFAMMLPVLISTWVQPINQMINTRFGSHLFNGAGVSAITMANNLFLIITGVFILSVTNVIFPRLSRLTGEDDKLQFKDTISLTIHASMYFVIPMTAGLMVLARPLVSLIYGGGEFTGFSITITSQALRFVSLGMIGYALQMILSRAYFARQNGKTPLIAGIISITVNLVLCVLLTDSFNVTGLALASAAAGTVNAIILIIPLQKTGSGFITKSFIIDMVKMLLSTIVMTAAVFFLMSFFAGMGDGKLMQAVMSVVPAGVGFVVYFVVTAIFGLSETKTAIRYVKRRFSARRA